MNVLDMNFNDILALCKAGFTAEQISKMKVTTPEPAPGVATPKSVPDVTTPEPAPDVTTPEPAPDVTTPEPAKQEKEVVNVPAPASVNADIVSAIADLKRTIVNSNIANSNQPAPKVDTVESIIDNMIGGNH